jgi:hypothetical protein
MTACLPYYLILPITCNLSCVYQVVMSIQLQKNTQKNKQHGLRVAYFQNCCREIETTVFGGNTYY